MSDLTRFRYYLPRVGLALLVVAVCVLLLVPWAISRLRPAVFDYALQNLPDRDRKALYELIASRATGMWEPVPEPLVSRIARRNAMVQEFQAQVVTNNAGMRSRTPYQPKAPNVFRIVCLGDSFVFGTAGAEEDRFCNQMGRFYEEHNVHVGSARVETYAVGIGGWNTVQEVSYLASRITAYDPDVIVVLTVLNDLMDSYGITGSGALTSSFTPEHRERGSAVFSSNAGGDFGVWDATALSTDLGPESRARWGNAMAALSRLTELQHRRGRRILHSVLDLSEAYFVNLFKEYFRNEAVNAPMLVTSFFSSRATRLPHDSHPNRVGHSLIASHYIHALNALGWIPVPASQLPELHQGLALDFAPPTDRRALDRARQQFVEGSLKTSLDFRRLTPADTRSFLGGIFPEQQGVRGFDEPPWATVRSGFLLRRPESAIGRVTLDIEILPLAELFPFELKLFVDGSTPEVFRFEQPQKEKIYTISGRIPDRKADASPALEIILETQKYFTWFEDDRMKSFRLLSAKAQ